MIVSFVYVTRQGGTHSIAEKPPGAAALLSTCIWEFLKNSFFLGPPHTALIMGVSQNHSNLSIIGLLHTARITSMLLQVPSAPPILRQHRTGWGRRVSGRSQWPANGRHPVRTSLGILVILSRSYTLIAKP